MEQEEQILAELRSAVKSALERAEQRIMRVQQELARWPMLPKINASLNDMDSGWIELEQKSEAIANGVDQELVSAQSSLEDFLKFGRELQSSLKSN
jgi:hypothetical protein